VARVTGKQIAVVALVLLIAGFFFRGPLPEILVPAEKIATLGPLPITNTLIATWITMIVLLLLFRAATANMQLVPRGVQNFAELAVESLRSFAVGVAGEHWGRRFFPLVTCIFLFIITNAWLSLVPGFGTVGLVHPAEHEAFPFVSAGPVSFIPPGASKIESGHAAPPGTFEGVLVPFFRGANTDLNTTIALALVAFVAIEMWGIQAHRFRYATKFINVGRLAHGQIGTGILDVFVGLLELISELVRIVSFSFRLFGNMFAGEVLLSVIVFLVPWSLVLVFYGLELFVGFVQALVFAGLTLVFSTMAVASHGEEHEAEHHV
jgi:F-type H+-transporting ATPase subunit a